MTQYGPLTQAALLKWVNSFETRRKAETLQDLRDGIILGQILEQMLAPEFHSSRLVQNPTSEHDSRQNLETVYRGLARFLRTDNPLLAPSPSEFRAIAENPTDNALCEFLTAFVTAACMGSLSTTYVPKVMMLDQSTQTEVAKIISQKTQLKEDKEQTAGDPWLAEDGDADLDVDIHAVRDPELMSEELEQMKAKVEILKRQNADLQSRLDKLAVSRQALSDDLKAAQDELASLKRTRGSDVTSAIRDLRNEIREKMAEIDRLEDLLEKETMRSTRLEKENESLRAKAQRLKDLEDKVTVLEHETKQQQQQIKGLENYKKKAQDLTIIQQRNRALDEQIQQLEQDLKTFDEVKAQNRRLQKEIEEKVKLLTTNEQEIIYTLQSKNVLQDANEELKRKVEYLESKRQLDESTIRELQEQLQLGDVVQSGSDSPGASTAKFNLEQELETTADPAVALRLEVQRLKAENGLLRNNMAVASENERLRSELESANQKVEHYRLQCTEAMEKHAVAQEQINALINNATGEGLVRAVDALLAVDHFSLLMPGYFRDAAFVNMRRDLLAATRELEKLRKRAQELERDGADRERELLRLKTELDAIGQEQTAALAALKSSDELISESLRTELEATRRQLTQRTFELDQMKEQLMGALVSKDKIQKKLDDALTSAAAGREEAQQQQQQQPAKGKKEDAEKIEKLKTALRVKMEQLEKSEQEKYDLQRRLKLAESGGAYAAQKAASDQIIKNLQRENAMITTAWYDLTSRLQSNHVVLQRRHDTPRSWLNKQRQMVNATPRR
ncbi:2abc8d43-7c5f-4e37-bf70-584a837a8689 [Thermothielavioides terrestris]|uniref:2abc8d43-7c5f-4e37-bf70-584a837a8689 n=1 Tax=Thermothielavioides terrestris TaxID=2587410 RepID=A0A446BYZ5_9PEZI|nr:2abc8d43-7c5f-4e37-bf70-584a837a8689 [Thermothielavioides terrestris]